MPPGARFTKAQRLLNRADFDRVQNGPSSRKAGCAHFLVLVVARQAVAPATPGPARLGMIASRRTGSAVKRNRVKRLVRNFFRTHAAEFGPFDVVVVVKSGASALAQSQVDTELLAALARLGVRLLTTKAAP